MLPPAPAPARQYSDMRPRCNAIKYRIEINRESVEYDAVSQPLGKAAAAQLEHEFPPPGHVEHQTLGVVAPLAHSLDYRAVIHAVAVLRHVGVDPNALWSRHAAFRANRERDRKVSADRDLRRLRAVGKHVAVGFDLARAGDIREAGLCCEDIRG